MMFRQNSYRIQGFIAYGLCQVSTVVSLESMQVNIALRIFFCILSSLAFGPMTVAVIVAFS